MGILALCFAALVLALRSISNRVPGKGIKKGGKPNITLKILKHTHMSQEWLGHEHTLKVISAQDVREKSR